MDVFELVVGAIVGLVPGVLVGLRLGEAVRERPGWWYWMLNAAAFVLGVVVTMFGFVWEMRWLSVAGVAVIGAMMTGLKYGYGRSVGVWRIHDEILRNDADMRE